jgi:cytochrome c oxidase cbb3-type subunit 3/ubiquinol-cytochrome c reductase cytochrome c subunit
MTKSRLRILKCALASGASLRSAVCLSVAALAAVGCDQLPGKPDPAHRRIAPSAVVDFDALYQRSCAGCHGHDGRQGPAPPLNDPLFLAIVPDAELERVIREGRARTSMPSFARNRGGTLTDEQIKIVARGLKPKWQSQSVDATQLPPYAVTTGNANDGKQVFAAACAGCHGAEGEGGDAGAINDVAFLSLISDQALRRFIITGRPDLGMPDYAHSTRRGPAFQPLTSAQIDDLVSLLAAWRTERVSDGLTVQ